MRLMNHAREKDALGHLVKTCKCFPGEAYSERPSLRYLMDSRYHSFECSLPGALIAVPPYRVRDLNLNILVLARLQIGQGTGQAPDDNSIVFIVTNDCGAGCRGTVIS